MRHAEAESEVQNLELLHLKANVAKSQLEEIKHLRSLNRTFFFFFFFFVAFFLLPLLLLSLRSSCRIHIDICGSHTLEPPCGGCNNPGLCWSSSLCPPFFPRRWKLLLYHTAPPNRPSRDKSMCQSCSRSTDAFYPLCCAVVRTAGSSCSVTMLAFRRQRSKSEIKLQ